jgi:RNA polymerase sigma-54 factor
MELRQEQVQRLSQQQLQSVQLLQMSAVELTNYLQTLSQENPVVDLNEGTAPPTRGEEDGLICRLRWLRDNDRQNQYYQAGDAEQLDPLDRQGSADDLEETLPQFLDRQLERLSLDREMEETVRCLISCLDEDGYFRLSLAQLAGESRIPLARLERGLEILRSLEPAGVGAEDLSQCLVLQLQRIGVTGAPVEIAVHYLEDLAKCHWHNIARGLSVSVAEVLRARDLIRELEPRPGAAFQRPDQIAYLQPDVFVEQQGENFVVRARGGERPPFQINSYYQQLLKQSDQAEVRDYLVKKVHQAQQVLWAIDQRESTLVRCAQAIVSCQGEFFRGGPCFLTPMRMEDVAQMLGVHPSTISRTVREKYLQCRWGVFPLGYFFSRSASAGAQTPDQSGSGTAARALLRQLIGAEDKAHPMSDQRLCEEMERAGCPISRRTVAKYREELHRPSAAGRRLS